MNQRMRRSGLVAASVVVSCAGAAFGQQFRAIDGSNNNLTNPTWGMVGLELLRVCPVNYLDGMSDVDMSRPNAREISNAIFDQPGSITDDTGLSEINWAWGQFIDHDIDHTLTSSANGVLSIIIPFGDPDFDNGTVNLGGQSINVSRANFATDGSGVRQQINNITAWLDASMVYGGRAVDGPVGVDRAAWLRTFSGGKLKTTSSVHGDLMPQWDTTAPVMANTNVPNMGTNAFVAGDVRANEHTALLSMHTLFVREHNRLCDVIAAANPGLTDEQLYQRARKIVGAEIQAITFNEYLPSMGVTLPAYAGYDAGISPEIANEFSTAGFRLGHTQLNNVLPRVNPDGTPYAGGDLLLADAFFNPALFLDGGPDVTIAGLIFSVQQKVDAKLTDGVRNQLFLNFIPGVGLVEGGMDLAAVNTMRGRDHGLGTYNETRIAYGLAPYASFLDATGDPDVANALASVYADIDEVDLWVGMLAEKPAPGSVLSETVVAIIADQFARVRDGDRFWYQHDRSGVNADLTDLAAKFDGFTTTTAADFLDRATLGQIITLNTNVNAAGNVFFAQDIGCAIDFTNDGMVNINDFFAYLGLYQTQNAAADLTGNGVVDINDFFQFLTNYQAGC